MVDLVTALIMAGRSPIDEPGVRVLTVHTAKGLEFKVVFLIGLNEGSFPDWRAKTRKEIQAELRAFYVAVTRARRELYLSRPRERLTARGQVMRPDPSPFLLDCGIEESRGLVG